MGDGVTMQLEWWHWAVLGIVLILAELAIPAFVLVWFGLGALLVALAVLVLPAASLTFQIGVWTLASLAMVLLWFRIFKPGLHKTRIGMADANVVGEVGMMVKDVAPFRRGQVRFQKPLLGDDLWECVADEAIASGERVRVLAVEGSLLKVGRA
jgi:hypothetical protein